MIKVEIAKEIIITNEEIAEHLWLGDDIMLAIENVVEDMLFNDYQIHYSKNVIDQLTDKDYAQILSFLAEKLREE